MKPPCELVVSKILPTLRSALVQALIKEHGLKQTEVAKLLSITQSAVSQYITATRAADKKLLKAFPEMKRYSSRMAQRLISGQEKASLLMFCDSCRVLRKKKEFCRHHRDFVQLARCEICFR